MDAFNLFALAALLAPCLAHAATQSCTAYDVSARARYNETIQKCVVPYQFRCSAEKWASSDGRWQCGSGEGGVCAEEECGCLPTHSGAILSEPTEAELSSSAAALNFFFDYTCIPRAAYGAACAANYSFEGITCVHTLSCVNSACVCVGDWDSDGRICRNEEWCNRKLSPDGLSLKWVGHYYEKQTKACKCEVGSSCEDARPELCPLHSTLNGGRCVCVAGFTRLNYGHELRQRDPTLPDTVCVPQGPKGQPCTTSPRGGSGSSTCKFGLDCAAAEGEGSSAICECDGDWSAADEFCYSQKNCEEQFPRPSGWSYRFQWMLYQKGSLQCTCLLGAPCPWPAIATEPDLPAPAPRVGCPANSTLEQGPGNSVTSCKCDNELTAINDETACAPKPRYGEPCEFSTYGGEARRPDPCLEGTFCGQSSRKCVCGYQKVWQPSDEKCLPFVGSPCTAEGGCVANAECGANNKCACVSGFYVESYDRNGWTIRICRPEGAVGAPCSSSADCKHFTECVSGKVRYKECGCQGDWSATESVCFSQRRCRSIFGSGASYESASGTCKCNVGASCELGAVKPENCPPGARPTEEGTGCECEEGHTPRNGGDQCVPARRYGEECQYSDPEYWSLKWWPRGQCLNASWCHGGVCKCHTRTSMWNEAIGSCVVKSGAECESRDVCTPNTKCAQGLCVCPGGDGYTATATGECFGSHGAICHHNGNCAPEFDCMDGKCACRSVAGQAYSPESGKCVSLVGAHCDPDDPLVSCAPNSTCDSTTMKCRCQGDDVPVQNRGRCFKALKYGTPCTKNDCDPTKGLACDGEGRCACADLDLVFHEEQGACLAPVDTQCGKVEVPDSCLPAPTGLGPHCEYYALACEPGLECGGTEIDGEMLCRKNMADVTGLAGSAPTVI